MKSEEDKDTKEEESEYEEDEDFKKIEELNLNEIVIVDDEGLNIYLIKKNVLKIIYLKKIIVLVYILIYIQLNSKKILKFANTHLQ